MSQLVSLLPRERWVAPELVLREGEDVVSFHLQDVFHYHGYDAVGGVVLGFRLLQKAIAVLSPQGLPQRRGFSLFTSFPGLGARDAFELTTRMVTDGRFRLDVDFDDTVAQEGVEGRFHFAFAYEGRQAVLAPVEGYPVPAFIQLGKASKQPGFSPEQQQAWRNAKFELANILLAAAPDDVIRVLG